jgi:hypothetical protein|tara:strand:- start:33 stop:425 length:393 start_codon:yes stop_codon:yes gene_type:complete
MFMVIVEWDSNNRITRIAEPRTEEEAQALVTKFKPEFPDVFYVSHVEGLGQHLVVDAEKKTVTLDTAGEEAEKINWLRPERDRLLAETDWTQSRDITLSNDDAWKEYRQLLRDFPSVVDVNNIVWPTKPE